MISGLRRGGVTRRSTSRALGEDDWHAERASTFSSRWLLLLLLGFWALAAGSIAGRSSFVGHADASNAVIVARNLLRGQGYSVNYVWHFIRKQNIPRSEDERPLLFPTLLALPMAILGDGPVSWRLPNIALVLGIVWLVRRISLQVYRRQAAANLTAITYLLLGQYQPIQVLNNTLLTFLVTAVVFVAALASAKPSWGGVLGLGALGGLALLARPDSMVLVGIVVGALTWRSACPRTPRGLWAAFARTGLPVVVVALAVWSPWLLRNWAIFGTFLHYDTSLVIPYRYDGIVMAADEAYAVRYGQPFTTSEIIGKAGGVSGWIRAEMLVVQRHLEAILGSTLGFLGLVAWILTYVKKKWSDMERRLFGIYALALLAYLSFMLGFIHYEERYYFPYVPILLVFVIGNLYEWHVSVPARGVRSACAVMGILFVLLLSAANIRDGIARLRHGGDGVPGDVQWVAANVPRGSRVMTRDPWETYVHTEREAVMVPYGTFGEILRTMHEYGVEFLVVRKPSPRQGLVDMLSREADGALDKLAEGKDFVAFRRVRVAR